MSPGQRWGWVALAGVTITLQTGCGTPGAPQPPSLNLPQPVTVGQLLEIFEKLQRAKTQA